MAYISEDFESTGLGTSGTFPKQCSAILKTDLVMIKGKPCKIVDISTTGEHGHAKVHLVGLDIFDNKKYEDTFPSTDPVDMPNVNHKEYQVMGACGYDGIVTIMNDAGDTAEINSAGGLAGEIEKAMEVDEVRVTVVSAMGKVKIESYKTATK